MKKKRKYQTVQPVHDSMPEPEKKIIPISAGRVQVGDTVTRRPITFSDSDSKNAGWLRGRVVWVHPLNRFHVVEFGEGQRAVRESFAGVAR